MSSKRETKNSLGGRIKRYEAQYDAVALKGLPLIVRLDGKSFHTLTKGMKRPYDENMSRLMISTTEALVTEFNPLSAYTQSDEISLLFYAQNEKSQLLFDGRINKINSVLAAHCSVVFDRYKDTYFPAKTALEVFDCRTFVVPSKIEAANYFTWRERDATKNSIAMAAQSMFSHKELHKKNQSQMQEMMFSLKGINWSTFYPNFFKRGTWIQRLSEVKTNEDGEQYTRDVTKHFTLDEPYCSKSIEDKVKFIFREDV